jgi:serine/threonine protein phosphatase 1
METQTVHALWTVQQSVYPTAAVPIVNRANRTLAAAINHRTAEFMRLPSRKSWRQSQNHHFPLEHLSMATSRTIAIGDIHGCLDPFQQLLAALKITADDTLVILGDVTDRGPESRGVIERLLELRNECRLICITGNHEEMLLAAIDGAIPLQEWLQHGGAETLDSYGKGSAPSRLPREHIDFLRSWGDYHETPSHFYAHGNYLARKPLDQQPWHEMRWESLRNFLPRMHCSGKTAILGHTSNKQGEILNLGYLVCIDTYAHGGGWLTALEPETNEVWQANSDGEYREGALPPPE